MSGADPHEDVLAVPLDRVRPEPAHQVRLEGLDAEHVTLLEENPDGWPPLLVVKDGDHYVLIDGFHRYAAAQNLALETVRVRIIEPPADGDLRGLAFAENAGHGKPLTLADRRAEAQRLLRANAAISNAQVARHTCLSPTTIQAIRDRLEETEEIEAPDKRIDSSGRSYTPAGSTRAPGELPEDRLHPMDVLQSKERRQQTRLARYLQKLEMALSDQERFGNWVTADDAADALRRHVGNESAENYGQLLGWGARRVLDVAIALGYEDDEA